jgi:hypothetical protein
MSEFDSYSDYSYRQELLEDEDDPEALKRALKKSRAQNAKLEDEIELLRSQMEIMSNMLQQQEILEG